MGMLDFLKEMLFRTFQNSLKRIEKEFLQAILMRINEIKRKIIKEIVAVLIMLFGFVLLVISALFFLIEYIHLTKTISFLIIGIIVLFIGIIIKIMD